MKRANWHRWILTSLLAILAIFLSVYLWRSERMVDHPIAVYVPRPPFSLDPMEYDADVHHVTQRPLFAGLISQYKAGEFVGILAKSWKISDDEKTWTFTLRNNLGFSNGDSITSEDMRRSLTRVAFLMNKKRSLSGFFERIKGFHEIISPVAPFPGIEAKDDQLIFHLTEPFPKFLETVSFGLYALVHPSNFDHTTGLWTAGKSAIYSGAYRLKDWNDHNFTISLRDDFPKELRHPNAYTEYRVAADVNNKVASDIIVSMDIDPIKPEMYQFFGPVKSGIVYIQLYTYQDAGSPLNNLEYRRYARDRFYSSMKSHGTPATQSFFPLSIPGVHELETKQSSRPLNFDQGILTFLKVKMKVKLGQVLSSTLKEAFAEQELRVVEKFQDNGAKILLENGRTLDIISTATGVLVEDPSEDIRFMILSKEGIKLPDPTGNLRKIVSQKNFSVQDVNKQLWDDAIIWPLIHVSSGIFVDPDKIDVSQLNTALPPIDVSWIGRK